MPDRATVLLVVEDEPDMREMIKAILDTDPRIEVVGDATNAEDAIAAARTILPGLIILDHQIEGEIMGIEAAPLLKEAAPNALILLFTAFDMQDDAALEPAIDEFLSKSDVGQLLDVVQRMLGLRTGR